MEFNILDVVNIDLLEIDSRTPSFRLGLNFCHNWNGNRIEYELNNLWFEPIVWNKWLEGMKKILSDESKETKLYDLDKNLELSFRKVDFLEFVFVFDEISAFKEYRSSKKFIMKISFEDLKQTIAKAQDISYTINSI